MEATVLQDQAAQKRREVGDGIFYRDRTRLANPRMVQRRGQPLIGRATAKFRLPIRVRPQVSGSARASASAR